MNQESGVRARLDRYKAFIEQDLQNESLHATAFDFALSAGALDDAGSFLDLALEKWPQDPYFLNRQAQLHAANKNWMMAEAVLVGLVDTYPDEPELVAGLGSIFYHSEQYARAREILEPVLSAGALPLAGYAILLRSLHHLGDLAAAKAVVEDRKDQVAAQGDAAGAAALICLDAGDFAQAAQWSGVALGLDPDSPEGLVTAGSVALGRHEVGAAEAILQRAIKIRPNEGRAWSSLGMTSLLRLDLPQAVERLLKSVSLSPGHVGTWNALGWTYISQKNLVNAEQVFRKAVEMDRNFADSHGGLAVVLAMQQKSQEAQAAVELALRLNRASLPALYAAALLKGEVDSKDAFTAVANRLLAKVQAPDGDSVLNWIRRAPLGKQ